MSLMRTLGRYVNNIPFPLTVRHYYPFDGLAMRLKNGQLQSAEAWDLLRAEHPHFMIPDDRDEWIKSLKTSKDGQDDRLETRAQQIVSLLKHHSISNIYSVGSGAGALEYFLKREMPEAQITASDYNPLGIERLRRVFIECKVVQFDMTDPDWTGMGGDDDPHSGVIMYRVDPHFTNAQWRTIFRNAALSRVHNILYMPAEIMTLRWLYHHRLKNLDALLRGRKPSFTGYARNDKALPVQWYGFYTSETVTLAGMTSFWLTLIV